MFVDLNTGAPSVLSIRLMVFVIFPRHCCLYSMPSVTSLKVSLWFPSLCFSQLYSISVKLSIIDIIWLNPFVDPRDDNRLLAADNKLGLVTKLAAEGGGGLCQCRYNAP